MPLNILPRVFEGVCTIRHPMSEPLHTKRPNSGVTSSYFQHVATNVFHLHWLVNQTSYYGKNERQLVWKHSQLAAVRGRFKPLLHGNKHSNFPQRFELTLVFRRIMKRTLKLKQIYAGKRQKYDKYTPSAICCLNSFLTVLQLAIL